MKHKETKFLARKRLRLFANKRERELRIKIVMAFVLMLMISLPFVDALSISNIRTTDVTDKSAVIRWSTDNSSDSTVTFGTDKNNLASTQSDFKLGKEHAVVLAGLNKSAEYFFKVRSASETEFVEDDNSGQFYAFSTASSDTFAPRIDVSLAEVVNKARIDVVGETEADVDLKLFQNGQLIRAYHSANGKVEFFEVALAAGQNNTLRIDAVDSAGLMSNATFSVLVDLVAPGIKLQSEIPAVAAGADLVVKGTISESASLVVTLNDEEIVSEEETTVIDISTGLEEGSNKIVITATDKAGNSDRIERVIKVDTTPPELEEVIPLDESPFYYEGRASDTVKGKTEPGATVYLFVAGAFLFGRANQSQPSFGEIKDKAQFKTTADAEGNFEFEDVDFEHPGIGIQAIAPREIQPGTEGIVGQAISELQQNERVINIHIAAVDQVGLVTTRQYQVTIGSCFSGFFDFNVKSLPSYQAPSLISPQRLESGTEIASFVLNTQYRGRATNNLRDPRAKQKDDNYFEVSDVILEPACRDNAFIDRNPSYRIACQLMQSRPAISKPINVERTNWFFQYNLGASKEFSDFGEAIKKLSNNELKFPLKVTINYREKLQGKIEQQKVQSLCRDVSYFVDIPIDPREVVPSSLLKKAQELSQQAREVIDKVLPTLESVIQYAGIGCMGSFGLRTITQIYRRFTEKMEFLKCKSLAAVGGGKCPIDTFEQLNSCYYIKDGDKVPYPQDELSAKSCPKGVKEDLEVSEAASHFAGTLGAWKAEMQLYQVYRWLCDRVFCRAAPAKWTQDASVSFIKQKKYEEAQCGTGASNARALTVVENCYRELAEKQKIIVTTRPGEILDDRCYALGNAIYVVRNTADPVCGGRTSLTRVDKKEITKVDTITAPDPLCAVQAGNTYYTADSRTCADVCKSGGIGWGVAGSGEPPGCLLKGQVKAEGSIYYPAGYTKDCWIDTKGSEDYQCYCQKNVTDPKRGTGVTYAGSETGQINKAVTTGGDAETPGEWPWNYREWQIYRSSGGKAGIYYPPERYYSGRDLPAAFGQNYLLDYIKGSESTSEVNPFTQHIGAFQSVCLTGIRGRLLLLKNILQGFENCMKQIETTGKADAGVCKEIFSQYVCNLTYKVFTLFQDKCSAQPFQKQIEFEEPGIQDFFREGSAAVTGAMDSIASEMQEEYGNAKLNQYLEGGSRNLMKKICLSAFGIESGFDLNNFIDAAYSVPFVTSAAVFSSEGAAGRREFLSFNPKNLQSVYEYRAAWTIFPGCDLESYQIELAAVNEATARTHKNIDCNAVGNYEPGSNGCDNWKGSRELSRQLFAGGRVTQGIYVDENAALSIEDSVRYDHVKITLNVDPRWDKAKCLPAENPNGVFYFPIKDATAKDLLQCSVDTSTGKFICSVGADVSALGQGWIESLECFDPATSEYRRCDRVVLTRARTDPVKIRANIFNSGQNKICVDANVQTANSGRYPQVQQFIVVPGLGRPASTPVDLNLINEITEDIFRGTLDKSISFIEPFLGERPKCTFLRRSDKDNADAARKSAHGIVHLTFEGATSGNFRLKVSGGAVEAFAPYKIENGGLKKDSTEVFSKDELAQVVYRMNGYGISNIVPDKAGVCQFQTFPPPSLAAQEQIWKVNVKLFYPDERNECSAASQQIPAEQGLAFFTEKTENVRVRETRIESPRMAAFNNGKRLYNSAVSELDIAKKRVALQSAIEEFKKVWVSPSPSGEIEEFLAYWYAVAAYAELMGAETEAAKKEALKGEIFGTIAGFRTRLNHPDVQRNTALVNSEEVKMIQAYFGEIEKGLGEVK